MTPAARLVAVSESIEKSLVLVKPDGYRRGLSGEVLRRIEAKGYTPIALAVITATPNSAGTSSQRGTARW